MAITEVEQIDWKKQDPEISEEWLRLYRKRLGEIQFYRWFRANAKALYKYDIEKTILEKIWSEIKHLKEYIC